MGVLSRRDASAAVRSHTREKILGAVRSLCAQGRPFAELSIVEIAAGRVTHIGRDGTKAVIAAPGGGPNGLALGPDNALYLCNNGGFGWVEAGDRLMPFETAPDYAGGSIQRIDLRTIAAFIAPNLHMGGRPTSLPAQFGRFAHFCSASEKFRDHEN